MAGDSETGEMLYPVRGFEGAGLQSRRQFLQEWERL
jgi:hypothetical protein